MKVSHFKNGNEIVWDNFNVCALNNFSGQFEHSTEVAEGKLIRVCLVNSFDGTADNVPTKATAYAMRKARRRDYTLINGDKVVGWATIHNDHTAEETEDNETEETKTEGAETTNTAEGAGAEGASAKTTAEGASAKTNDTAEEKTEEDEGEVVILVMKS